MRNFFQDLRYALWIIRKRPGTYVVIVLTLALGIGVNTMFFTFFSGMILRPLPFQEPGRLVVLNESQPKFNKSRHPISSPNLRDWQEHNQVFEAIAPFVERSFNLHTESEPERLSGANISASVFPLLGIKPARGRNFNADEDQPGSSQVVLISHAVWERRFDSRSDVLGRQLYLDDRPYQIVGVMPPNFRFPHFAEIWTPLALDPGDQRRDHRWLQAVARLRRDNTIEKAQAEMSVIAKRLEDRFSESNSGWGVRVRTLRDAWLPPVTQISSFAQQVAVFFVLLIACANVANLMLAQATRRRHEIAIRAALGAGRRRLIRQFLTEGALLALLGGILGTILALWGDAWLKALVLVPIPYWLRFDFDRNALIFSLLITLAAGAAFGLVPALRSSKLDLTETLRSGGRFESSSRNRLRNVLVASQFALSVILLVGALLMIRSFLRLQKIEVGYRTEGTLTMRVSLTGEAYQDPKRRVTFLNDAIDRVRGISGVANAGAANYLPASNNGYAAVRFETEGEIREREEEHIATYHTVTESYLETLGIPLVEGRMFTAEEILEGHDVALVSDRLARELWTGRSAIGRRIRLLKGNAGEWLTVVGVVGNVEPAYQVGGLDSWPRMQLYVPYGKDSVPIVTLAVQSHADPAYVAADLRKELHKIDPRVPIFEVFTMDRVLDRVNWIPRLWSQLFSLFGIIALVLALTGTYSVVAYSVSRRTREMGIRIALGARPSDVLRVIIRDALTVAAIGIALGLMVTLPMTRFLSSLLYQISPSDPVVFGGVLVLLALASVTAAYIPARRATHVDPVITLRAE